jgi:tRNA(Ile)-lysidine synthase
LTELWPGTALAERARIARYEALSTLCAEAGIPHLLLGHHAADQAETVLMRGLRSSGPAGLAAMPLVTEHRAVRLIRPLLKIPPGWLRTMLQEAGVGWVEDPSNTNRNALRARLRARRADSAGTGAATTALVEAARACGGTRARHEAQIAQDLAAHAELRPEGFAVLRPGPVRADTLAALLQAVAGAAYPPSASQLTNVARTLEPGTLAGVRIMPAGRVGPGMLFVREAAAMAAPVPALPGATWDSRFRLSLIGAEFSDPRKTPVLGPVGDDAARLRSWSELPAAVLRTLPALRDKGGLAVVPHLEYPDPRVCEQVRVAFAPARAAAAAPFFTQ